MSKWVVTEFLWGDHLKQTNKQNQIIGNHDQINKMGTNRGMQYYTLSLRQGRLSFCVGLYTIGHRYTVNSVYPRECILKNIILTEFKHALK